MTGPAQPDEPRAGTARGPRTRSRLGAALMVLGLVGILLGVFHVLNAVNRYESRDFAHRKRDYEVRKTVHERFPGAVLRGLGGLGLILLGAHVRKGGGTAAPSSPGSAGR